MKKIKIKTSKLAAVLFLACLLLSMFNPLKAYASNSSNPFDALGEIKEQIADAFADMDTETAESVFAFLKEKVQNGALDSQEKLEKALDEGEGKFGFEMRPEDAKRLVETMDKLEDMGFSAEAVIDKSEKLYQEYGADFVDHTEEIIADAVKDTVTTAVEKFFTGVADGIGKFFRDIFS